MGFFDSPSQNTQPFSFDYGDPASAKGAMLPVPWASTQSGVTTNSGSRRKTNFASQSAAAAGGVIDEETPAIEGIGRTDINVFGGIPSRGQPLADPSQERPDIRAATELAKNLPDGPIQFAGEAVAQGVNFLADVTGAVPFTLPFLPGGPTGVLPSGPGTEQQKYLAQFTGTSLDEEALALRERMKNDPHYATQHFNDFITRYKYDIAREIDLDPLLVETFSPAGNLQDQLFQTLQLIGLPGQAVGRVFAEHGPRNIEDDILNRPDADLDEHLREAKARFLAGDITKEDFITEITLQGGAYTNDALMNMVFEMVLDPLNLFFGAGLIAKTAGRGVAGAATFANRSFLTKFGKEGMEQLVKATRDDFVTDFTQRAGRAPTPTEIERAGIDRVTRYKQMQKTHPEFVKQVRDQMPRKVRAYEQLAPTLDAAAQAARLLNFDLGVFLNRGAHTEKIAAFSSSQSVEGVTFSYGIEVMNQTRKLFSMVDGGDDIFTKLLGRMGANMEAAMHRETMVRGAITGGKAPPAHYTPTDAVTAMSSVRTSRTAIDVEGLTDRIATQWLPQGKVGDAAYEETMKGVRRASRERLKVMLGDADADAVARFVDGASEKQLALVEHLYYMDVAERQAIAMASDQAIALAAVTKAKTKLASVSGKKMKAKWKKNVAAAQGRLDLADRYILLGSRELTNTRAKKLRRQVRSGDAVAVREAIEKYDKVYDNFSSRGLSDVELIRDMEVWLDDIIDSGALVKELSEEGLRHAPNLRKIMNDEKSFASKMYGDKDAGYRIGLKPDEDQLWRASYSVDGNLIGINPWVDAITETAKDWHAGRFTQGKQYLLRPVRGQKMLEEAKRGFYKIANTAGLSRAESAALFSAIRGEANRIGVLPRGLTNDELWRVANGIDINKKTLNAIGERGVGKMVAKAFEGQMHTVGVSNKISGRIKQSGGAMPVEGVPQAEGRLTGLPLLGGQPGPYIRVIAEKYYPQLRFRFQPIFIMQELLEPFYWNILRGIKPGIRWRAEDLETLESMRLSGLIDEFEDQYEYSASNMIGAQAAKETFGQGTQVGKLWGQHVPAGRRVQSLAELKRLNYVRQMGKRNGELLKTALDGIDETIWLKLEDEVAMKKGRASMKDVANHYWLGKGMYSPDDPHAQLFLMDGTLPNGIGKRASIKVEDVARFHAYDNSQSLRKAIGNGTYSEAKFIEKMKVAGFDTDYTQRAWMVLHADSPTKFWAGYRSAVRDALGIEVKAADRVVKATRKLHAVHAKRVGMTEEEFLATRYNGPVQYMDSAARLPRGVKMQALLESPDPAVPTPAFFGAPLRKADDVRVQRVTEPYAKSFATQREVVGPRLADPLGGAPTSHPDVQATIPQGGKRVGSDPLRPQHTTGQKSLDNFKEDAENVLGDDDIYRAADEAAYVPSLMLRITEAMPDETLVRLLRQIPEETYESIERRIQIATDQGDTALAQSLNLQAEALRKEADEGGRVMSFADMADALERGEDVDMTKLAGAGVTPPTSRELGEEEVARRLLRAFSMMMTQEDMDLGAGVTALMGLADGASGRSGVRSFETQSELFDLMAFGDEGPLYFSSEWMDAKGIGMTEVEWLEDAGGEVARRWRADLMMRSFIDGDVAPTSSHQMRAFGYTDDIAVDDLNHGLRVRRGNTSTDDAERYGVLTTVARDEDALDLMLETDELAAMSEFELATHATEVRTGFLNDPRGVVDIVSDSMYAGAGLTDGMRGSIAMALDLDTVVDMSDEALISRLFDEAEVAVSRKSLWEARSGRRLREIGEPRDRAQMDSLLAGRSDWNEQAVLGESQHRFMSRQYEEWAADLNAEEYLGRTDWTAARVAAVDNARYTQFTRSGAAWDMNATSRQHYAVLHYDSGPSLDTQHTSIFPSTEDMGTYPHEVAGLNNVERDAANWWAPELESSTGVTVHRVRTTTEDRVREGELVITKRSQIPPDMEFFEDDILKTIAEEGEYRTTQQRPAIGHRTSMVVSGTPEQVERAVLATGGTFQRDSVTAVSMGRRQALGSVGPKTGYRVTGKSAGWKNRIATDMVVPKGTDPDDIFDLVTDLLDKNWKDYDFGRLVFDDEDGNTVIRVLHDADFGSLDMLYEGTEEQMQAISSKGVAHYTTELNEYSKNMGGENAALRGQSERGQMTSEQAWANNIDKDPWLIELDRRGFTDAAGEVRDRYRGEATQQVDWAHRKYTPDAYSAKRGRDSDLPPPIRDWKFQSGKRGIRGAVAADAQLRNTLYLLKGADAKTILHETFHVFARDLEPSMETAMLKVYAAENQLEEARVLAKGMTNKAEDWLAENYAAYIATGLAPDPSTQMAYNAFGKMLQGIDEPPAALKPLMAQFAGLPDKNDALFHPDEHRIFQAARTAMSNSEDEAFTTHYFKRGRSFLERSVNHPYLGLYPASYMWGKALPELMRFLVAKPFGVNAPLWGMSQAMNVWEGISTELNTNSALRELVEGEHAKELVRFMQMLIPGSPIDLPVQAPAWLRSFFRQMAVQPSREERGLDFKPPDVLNDFARSGGYTMNPLRIIETVTGIGEEVRQGIVNIPDIFGDGLESTDGTQPATGEAALWAGDGGIQDLLNP